MTGLDAVDAVMLFFGYVFVAITPIACVLNYGKEVSSKVFGFFGVLVLLWWIVVMSTLFSLHDFIFYVGVIG